jgi:hypothetical protein
MECIKSGIKLLSPNDTITGVGGVTFTTPQTMQSLVQLLPMFFSIEINTTGTPMLCVTRINGVNPMISAMNGITPYLPQMVEFVGGRPNDR